MRYFAAKEESKVRHFHFREFLEGAVFSPLHCGSKVSAYFPMKGEHNFWGAAGWDDASCHSANWAEVSAFGVSCPLLQSADSQDIQCGGMYRDHAEKRSLSRKKQQTYLVLDGPIPLGAYREK